jgi:hypothetical protein
MADVGGPVVAHAPFGIARAVLRLDPVSVMQTLGRLPASLARVPAIIEGIELLLGAVGELVTQVAGTVQRADLLVGGVGDTVRRAEIVVDDVETTVGRVPPLLSTVDEVAGDVGGLVRESDAIRVAIAAILADLTPLLTAAARVDTTLPANLERTLEALPVVLGRLDAEVIPAVRSLEGLVPTIQSLSARVDELHRVVGDVGDTLGGIPGAARLRKRSSRAPEPANP